MEKTCTKCGYTSENPRADFSPKKGAKDGLHPYCKTCKAAAQKQSRVRNPDYDKEYYHKNPEKRKSSVRVQRAIAQGRLAIVSTLPCAMQGCTRQAEHYHHLDYVREARISPVCAICHAQIHSGDAGERDLTNIILLDMENCGPKPKM